MNILTAKKVDRPWQYELDVNGHELPFVYTAEVIENEKDTNQTVLIVKMIVAKTADCEIVIK